MGTTPDVRSVGIVGLGEMGLEIAVRLLSHGVVVHAYDVNPDRRRLLSQATWADSVVRLVSDCRTLLVTVHDDSEVKQVIREAWEGLSAPFDLVIHSTVAPQTVLEASMELSKIGVTCIDAGMSRGPGRMRDGSLTLFVGGPPDAVERLRAVFEAYSDNIVYAGLSGAGMIVKLCNNMALHGNKLILMEIIALSLHAGVDTSTLLSGIRTSTGASWVADRWSPRDTEALSSGLGDVVLVRRTRRELALYAEMAAGHGQFGAASRLVSTILPDVLSRGLNAQDV